MRQRAEKIEKVLAAAGICSRKKAGELIRLGLVKLDGRVLDDPAVRVDPQTQVLEYCGERVHPAAETPSCLLLYKIAGFVTSASDPHNKRTVYDLLPEHERDRNRWLYVGRLDRDSEGLLLFTDSGDLAHRLTHPSFKVPKRYRVEVEGRPEASLLKPLTEGLTVDGRKMRMDRVRVLRSGKNSGTLEVTLHQGEKRQVKRMLGQLGFKVAALLRTHFGPLTLKGLEPGGCRRLSRREVVSLLESGEARQ
ncbi:MAG: rRNA pseudouridine synthase [Candidatus Glassbacteria bacterium]|nr:rRNA pseudouridine synthase [Candidatus Glassbacteria bacterium]